MQPNKNIASILDFSDISGTGGTGCFIRVLGVGEKYNSEIAALDKRLDGLSAENRLCYKRLGTLRGVCSAAETEFYLKCRDGYIKSEKTILHTKEVKGGACAALLAKAMRKLEELCLKSFPNITETMIKNMFVMALYKFDVLFGGTDIEAMYRLPKKIVLTDVTGRNDYLFSYMLTLIGCDVMLLQYRSDISVTLDSIGLSTVFVSGRFGNTEPPPYKKTVRKTAVPPPNSMPVVTIPPRPEKHPSLKHTAQSTAKNSVRRGVNITSGDIGGKTFRDSRRTEKTYEQLANLAASVVLIMVNDRRGETVGSGSGIMIGPDGFILTNKHVVDAGAFFSVRIENDEAVYNTNEIIKYNTVTDMAIIRIQRKLVPLPVYNGKQKLARGQKVVAIGSPLGLFNSVSDGIISGMRSIRDIEMIQFTAPISHGSSGGALLNMYGEVIGLSTAGIDEGQNINLAVGYEYINPFIMGFVN